MAQKIAHFIRDAVLSKLSKLSTCLFLCAGTPCTNDFFSDGFNQSCAPLPEFNLESGPCFFDSDLLQTLPSRMLDFVNPFLVQGCLPQEIKTLVNQIPVAAAAASGNLDGVKLLFKKELRISCCAEEQLVDSACLTASAFGQREVLHFLFKKIVQRSSFTIEPVVLQKCCLAASLNGQRKTLKFLLNDAFPENFAFVDIELLNSCCLGAALHGQVNVLRFLLDKAFAEAFLFPENALLDSCCLCAASRGQLGVLKFLFKRADAQNDWFPRRNLLRNCQFLAAKHGHLDVLEFLKHKD